MNKLLIALLAGLCCGSSYAQSAPAPAPAASITFPVAPAPAPAPVAGATVAGLPVSTMIPVGSGSMPSAPAPAPGLYVAVVAGSIHFSNPAGSTAFAAGQFGFTASPTAPPMIIPSSPGHAFTPPPSFSFTGMGFPVFGSAGTTGSTGSGSKTESIDCEVR